MDTVVHHAQQIDSVSDAECERKHSCVTTANAATISIV
jgi:hypothetical protein